MFMSWYCILFFFFKQKTAYDVRISDWRSDVCSSDLVLAHPAAEREREVGDFLIGADLVGAGARDVQDLAADRQDRLRLAVARLLGAAAGAVALDDKQF